MAESSLILELGLPKMQGRGGSFLFQMDLLPFVWASLAILVDVRGFGGLGSEVELVEASGARISDAGLLLLIMRIGSGVVRVLSVRKDSLAGRPRAKSVRGGV